MRPDPSVAAGATAKLGRGAFLLLLTAAVFVTAGHYYGAGPDYTYLLGGLRLVDPSLLARDWFSGLTTYTPAFAILTAAASLVMPLPVAWALLHAAAVMAILEAARRVLVRIGGDWATLAIFVVASLRWDSKLIGGHAFWPSEVHPQALAQSLLVVAMAGYLLARPRLAALAGGAATVFHPPMGFAIGGALGLGFLRERRRYAPAELLHAGALYAALALPLAVYFLLFEREAGAAPPGTFLAMARMRLPHHFLPSTWASGGWLGLAGVSGLFFLGTTVVERDLAGRARFLFAVLAALLAASFVFVEVWPVTLIVKFQFARLSVFLRFLAALFAAAWISRALTARSRLAAIAALAALAATSIAVFALLGAVYELARRSLAAARWPQAIAATLVLVLIGLWARHADPALRLEWVGPRHAFAEACVWIRGNTRRDALFLSPPELGGFSFFSRRATVVDFHRNPFAENAIVEWRRRLAEVIDRRALDCAGLRECNALLRRAGELPAEAYRRLAAKYGAEYMLIRRRDDLPFRRLYRNGGFDVYEISGENS